MKRALVLLVASLATENAAAAPSVWDRARDARGAHAERVLVRMERVFDGVSQAAGDSDMMSDFRQGTLVVAEMSGARALSDPRLLLLLAEAMLGLDADHEREARALLDDALRQLGPDDAWLEAEILAATAAASRESPAQTLRETTRALTTAFRPTLRCLLFRRRADARMALGDVRASIRDARSALAFAANPAERVLSGLALGLALERSGDQPAAWSELHAARLVSAGLSAGELEAAIGDVVFAFRPEDAAYVSALTSMEAAASGDEADKQAELYERAREKWNRYLRDAKPDDRWLGNARSRQRECERAQSSLAKRPL